MSLKALNPAVPRRWLFGIAGVVWTIAGGILCYRAGLWLADERSLAAAAFGSIGLILAFLFYVLGFIKIAARNIDRIRQLPERACVFAFAAWRGYLMIGTMMALGITLRNSSIPKDYLAVPYVAMGGALLIASVQFYINFWKISIRKASH